MKRSVAFKPPGTSPVAFYFGRRDNKKMFQTSLLIVLLASGAQATCGTDRALLAKHIDSTLIPETLAPLKRHTIFPQVRAEPDGSFTLVERKATAYAKNSGNGEIEFEATINEQSNSWPRSSSLRFKDGKVALQAKGCFGWICAAGPAERGT